MSPARENAAQEDGVSEHKPHSTGPSPHAIDELAAVARQILGSDFDGTAGEAIAAAAGLVAAHGSESLAHWFADLILDLESHGCIDGEWCFVCEQQAQQERDRR